ncbi:MAG: hypothetical protein QM638_14640, partial [Nocardioides sp.]|uniref:hypothetical protein n=1 Tax=Nocardioides sp. TaxID=35761 RepID=UPI0039E440F7
LRGTGDEGELLRRHALSAADRDAGASRDLVEAIRGGRTVEVAAAAIRAADTSLAILDLAALALPAVRLLGEHADPRVRADVVAAATAYGASARIALVNLIGNTTLAASSGAARDEVERLQRDGRRFRLVLADLELLASSLSPADPLSDR